MKNIIIITSFLLILVSGLLAAKTDYKNIHAGLLKNKIHLSSEISALLVVPENSCKGCFEYLTENYKPLLKNKNLKFVFLKIQYDFNDTNITEFNYFKNEKYFDEFYGITLFFVRKSKIYEDIQLNPNNISEIVNILSRNNLLPKDILKIVKMKD